MLALEGLIGLHITIQLQLIQHYFQDIDLDYCDIEWFALEMNRDQSVIFETASKYRILDFFFFFTMMAIPFLLRDSCPR